MKCKWLSPSPITTFSVCFIVLSLRFQMAKYLKGSACFLWDGYCCFNSVMGMELPPCKLPQWWGLAGWEDSIRASKGGNSIAGKWYHLTIQRVPWYSHYVRKTKLVLHECLYLVGKNDRACVTKLVTSGHGLCLRRTSQQSHFCMELESWVCFQYSWGKQGSMHIWYIFLVSHFR